MPSGFLGVDIFFVISGFVVTSSILNRSTNDWREYLSGFYSRRIKRLLPALSATIITTSILGCFFIPSPQESLKTGLFGLIGASNILLFKLGSDYFAASTELNLFTHTWSLGLEEQFYIVFPIILYSLNYYKISCTHNSKRAFFAIAALFSSSFLLYLYFELTSPIASFYLMPLRFWQLGLGSLIYILSTQEKFIFNNKLNTRLSNLSLFIIITSLALPKEYQTSNRIFISLASAILIYIKSNESKSKKLLSSNLMVSIGIRSYSIYLWHWPLLVLAKYTIGITLLTTPFLLLFIFIFSLASYKYIEVPFRESHSRNWIVIIKGFILIFISSIFIILLAKPLNGLLFLGEIKPTISAPFKNGGCRWTLESPLHEYENKLSDCIIKSAANNAPTIFITGDSHAESLGEMMNLLARNDGYNIDLKIAPGCLFPSSFLYTYDGMNIAKNTQCHNFQLKRQSEILSKAKQGDIVLNVNFYSYYLSESSFSPLDSKVKKYEVKNSPITTNKALSIYTYKIDHFAKELAKNNTKLIILLPQLQFKKEIGECTPQWFNLKREKDCSIDKEHFFSHRKPILEGFNKLKISSPQVVLWDPIESLCPGKTCQYYNKDNESYYTDRDHFSKLGAQVLYQDFINKIKSN